jgi:transcriptional regulator with XRE-family HTH domain
MRHALGLSRDEFARVFRLTRRQLAEIERGEGNPTIETLNRGRPFGFGVGFVPVADGSSPRPGHRPARRRLSPSLPTVTAGGGNPSATRRENEMGKRFKVGDHVTWNSEAGRVSGTIIKVHSSDVDYKGYTHHASEDEPQYEIKSDRTDHIAMHKGLALKLSAK